MVNNKFTFYTPIEIKKSKDKEGNAVMRIGGIASTMDEDSDGEFLDPNGFVIEDFMKVGFVNWHHQAKNKPKTIVGEPSLAEIRPDGFYVECDLYPNSETAREIYETAEILEKDSKTRRLGFSIEGEVIERGSDDAKHKDYKIVKKANITGLAITHMPKNAQTFAQIIKAMGGEDTSESVEDEDAVLTTKTGKAIIKESLDKKIKKLVPDTNINIKKSKFEIINLEEEKMYDKIFDTFTDINIEKAEKVFTMLTKISNDMKKGAINDDKLEKAMNALGLDVDGSNPFLVKAESDEDVQADAKKVAKKIQSEFYDEKDEKDEKDEEETEETEETKTDKVEKSKTDDLQGKENGLFLLVKKELSKAKQQSTIENRAIGVMVQNTLQENQLLKGQVERTLSAFEAQSQLIEEQSELIKGLVNTLQNFGSAPQPRKSVTRFVEKFDAPLEKGNSNSTVLSMAQHRSAILEILDQKTFEKGYDEQMSNATLSFESSGSLPADVLQRIKAENQITITQ
jgi:hypothetical protein